MISFEQFHFLRPLWLIVLVPLVILIWMMIKRKIGSRSWESFCDEALLPYVLINKASKSSRMPMILTSIIGLLAVISLAGPVWEKLPQPVFSRQNSLVIALDLSLSMDADDITPSRLARARFKIADILEKNKEAQTALLVYAGDAFTVTPLTDDSATILSQLKALTTDIMPVQGNRTDIALVKAVQLLKQAGLKSGNVLLMTDEIDAEKTRAEAISLKQQGYRLFVLGIGTDHGVPVPLADGSFLKDSKGKIVVPVLNEKAMQSIAKLGGGRYLRVTVDDRDIDSLQTIFTGISVNGEIETTKLQTDVWYEQGPWLLIFLLPFTALLFRRGYLVILIFLLPFPDKAQAFDWDNLWSTADQRAKRVLDSGDHLQAAKIFKDPQWKAAANYQAGEFDAAIESLATVENIEGLYNKANALARTGRYQEAIEIYKKVLAQKNDHGDALYNKKLLEDELENQQQQQDNQQSDNKQDDQDQQQQGQQQQSQDGNSSDQESSDQQQSEEMNKDQEEQQSSSDEQQAQQNEQEKEQAEQQAAQQQAEQDEKQKSDQEPVANSDMTPTDEEQQAAEQWLRRIPDDPSELLRRKFLYQYKQRAANQQSEHRNW